MNLFIYFTENFFWWKYLKLCVFDIVLGFFLNIFSGIYAVYSKLYNYSLVLTF